MLRLETAAGKRRLRNVTIRTHQQRLPASSEQQPPRVASWLNTEKRQRSQEHVPPQNNDVSVQVKETTNLRQPGPACRRHWWPPSQVWTPFLPREQPWLLVGKSEDNVAVNERERVTFLQTIPIITHKNVPFAASAITVGNESLMKRYDVRELCHKMIIVT